STATASTPHGVTLIPYTTLFRSPDVLIIETSVINNHNKNVSLEDTYASLEQLHTLYSEALPEARILFISPNPITENKFGPPVNRSEEHTSELQSRENLVCRLLLE